MLPTTKGTEEHIDLRTTPIIGLVTSIGGQIALNPETETVVQISEESIFTTIWDRLTVHTVLWPTLARYASSV